MKILVFIVTLFLSCLSFAQTNDSGTHSRIVNIVYYSSLLKDPTDMVNFSGYMEILETSGGVKVYIYQRPVQLSMNDRGAKPILAASFEGVAVPDRPHVFQITLANKSEGSFQVIFNKDGIFDFTDVFVGHVSTIMNPGGIRYTSPEGKLREIQFLPPFPSNCNSLLGGGAA